MDGRDTLAARFEETRPRLRAVAWRMLGSEAEADDAVQEAWIRLGRSDTSGVDNLAGWLTTVVARVCLDMLRSRKSRKEDALEEGAHEPAVSADEAIPFEDIARIVGRSPAAARQLASRARRRVQGAERESAADRARQREVVEAFLAASRDGDFEGLLTLLDPSVVVHMDAVAAAAGGSQETRGASEVATMFKGRARAAVPALLDGAVGLAWAGGGKTRGALFFTVVDGKVAAIDVVMDPARLAKIEIELL